MKIILALLHNKYIENTLFDVVCCQVGTPDGSAILVMI